MIRNNIKSRCKKILYLLENKKNHQYRYRYYNIKNLYKENGSDWKIDYVWIDGVRKSINTASFIVIERQTAKSNAILKLIREIHKKEKKVVFDIDDLVFDYKDLGLILSTVEEKNIFYWAGYIWGIRRIAKKVDGFLCTNDFLGKKLERSFGKPYRVIPNSLNKEQIEVSEKCLKNKKHEGFVVGYFSGSPTHVKDFALVESELACFLREHDDVKLRVVGYMEFSDEMKKWIGAGRLEVKKPVDYLELQRLMAEVDVNIAPLVINDFTNCKSELKFFEAAAVETTTIASPTYTFKKAIKDGENGFLAQPGEWYEKLEYLYKNPEENKKIAKKAREYALKHYYGKEFLKEVEEAYDYFAK